MSDVAVRFVRESGRNQPEHDRPGRGGPAGPRGVQNVDRRLNPYLPLVPLLAEFVRCEAQHPRRQVLRDRLAHGFTPVVRHLSRRYQGRGEPVADLEQVGMIGLLGALDRFDPPAGCRLLDAFLGFAIPTITGEIRRHFRDRTWAVRVPRRLKDQQVRVRAAVESLSAELGRAPRPTEIAARLGCDVAELIELLEAQNAYSTSSLDEPAGDGGATLADRLGDVDPVIDRIEHREALRNAIAGLPERERTILVLRFFDDLTQTQIAAKVGLSQMHVSRLLQRSLSAIRQQLNAP
jgi:RNA polymerase sigma-B factor